MKLLKETYKGLSEVDTLPKFIKDFLSDPDNQKLLTVSNFVALYEKADINSYYLTEVLISSGIDPLDYLDHIQQSNL